MIRRLRLRNLHRHRGEFAAEFAPGMNALVGPNGAGKSNLLACLQMALTGDFPGGGPLAGHASWGGEGPAWLEADLALAGVEVTVRRQLAPKAGHRLLCSDGSDALTQAKAVDAKLLELLGVSKATLEDYVFVRQGELTAPVEAGEAEQARRLGRLFGLEEARRLYDLLGEARPRLAAGAPAAELEHQAGRREAEAREAAAAAAAGREALASARSEAELRRREAEARGVVRAYEAARDARARRERQAARRELLGARLAAVRADEAELAGDLAQMDEALGEAEAVEGVMRRRAAARAAAVSARRHWQDAAREEAEARRALERERAAEPPAVAAPQPDAAAAGRRVIRAEQELEQAAERERRWHNRRGCPECGQPAEHLAGEYARRRADAEAAWELAREAYAEALAAASRAETRRAWEERLRRAEEEAARAGRERRRWEGHVGEDSSLAGPDPDEVLRELGAARADRERLAALVGRRREDLRRLEGELEALGEASSEAEAGPPEAAYEQALAELEAVRRAERERGELEAEVRAAVRRHGELAAEAGALARRAEEARRREAKAAVLERVRQAFGAGPEGLPAAMARRGLARLVGEVNEHLALFDAPFRAEPGEGVALAVRLPGSPAVAPRRALSGGQKAVFALAVRLALHRRFAAPAGVLCLDEPTAYLDGAARAGLGRALAALGVLARGRRLQVFLVTHDRGFDHLFDRVVELPG